MEHTTTSKAQPKRSAAQSRPLAPAPQPLPTWVTPDLAPLQRLAADLSQFTLLPVKAQRQAVQPVFQAARLQRAEEQRWTNEQRSVQRQMAALPQAVPVREAVPLPAQPVTPGDWVTVMRQQAKQIDGQRLSSREHDGFIALQRQVAHTLVQGFRQDRQAPEARYAQYGEHLATLQRHPNSVSVSRVVLNLIPQRERLPLQQAVDQALQRQMDQEAQEQAAGQRHTLQRKKAELDEEALQPVIQRIQARRGAGNPLPAAIQRYLEQGLNHDLSRIRIHDDAEADKLSKKVNALAFTTGTDIFFQSGQFNPNTQSGLELLAHEVTHTVQQSKGQVGTGVDPDAGLEAEARSMGAKLAQFMPSPKSLLPPNPHAPGTYSTGAALSRTQQGAVTATLHQPFKALGLQRQAAGITIQRNVVLDKVSDVAAHLPGYRELCLAFGQDLVTGKRLDQNPNAILDALGALVPGPFKSMLQAVRQQNLIPKAWAWFKGELGKLKLGSVLSEVKGAIGKLPPDFGAAKAALTRRAEGLKRLVAGSARHLAQIALTAIEAGLGPVGKKVMGLLRQGGDVIVQVLRDPAKFARNLLQALSQGFGQFRTNAGQWLKEGLGTWLTGASGVSFPATLDLKGVFLTALSVMGLTYQALRGRLVKELGAAGEQKVAAAEKAGGALGSLSKGLHLAPEVKGQQSSIGQGVVDGLKGEVTRSLLTAGAAKVASLLVPGGVFVQALLTAFQGVQTLIGQGGQIMGVILNALGSVSAIAAGQVGAAAGFIERTIGGSVPIVLTFLGKLVGLGNIGTRIKNTVKKLRTRLDAKIDQLVGRMKKALRATATPAASAITASRTQTHDQAVQAGLDDIPRFEEKYTINGILPKNAAKRVAKEVKAKHRVFKKVIAHVDQGQRAKYEWFASHGWQEGAKKLGGRIDVQAELVKAKASAPSNWTAVFATGGKKLQCIPDVNGNTDLTLSRVWQHSGLVTADILDSLADAMEKTLLASHPALQNDRAVLDASSERLAQIVFKKIADRHLFYVKWTEIPRKLKPGPHLLVRDPAQGITKYATHAKNAVDESLNGLVGEIHHAVSLYLGGGNAARNLVAAAGQARVADTAHHLLHKLLDTTVITKALSGLADDYALDWASLAKAFDDSTAKVLIGTCQTDGDITYNETSLDFNQP